MKYRDLNFRLRIPQPETHFDKRLLTGWLPTRGNVLFTLLMIGLLLWAQTAGALPLGRFALAPSAPSTSTIAYQGRLADASGNPLTQTVNMTFRLYNVATGGGEGLWAEDWIGPNGVQVSDGLFNVMLGSLTPIPAALITSNSSLFLGITVDTDDEMAPRVQLGTVPFAVQALTVPDGSVTTEKIADGAVTQSKLGSDVSPEPPDGSITTAKLASQAVTTEKIAGGAVTQDIAPQLLKNVHRQDRSVATQSQTNQYLAKGWDCWGPTDGSTATYVRNVSFPIAFSDVPIITLSLAGDFASNTPPDSHGGLGIDMGYRPALAALGQSASGFSAQLITNPIYPSGHIACFTWIAIGTLAQ